MSNFQAIRDKAIELSRQACEHDRNEQYEEAYKLYKLAIKHFIHLAKCNLYSVETNPILRENFEHKAIEYIDRAEKLSSYLQRKDSNKSLITDTGVAQKQNRNTPDEEANAGLKRALESAIITEKPDVKWNDVAGLEGAKQALQEAVILPIRFPELFVGRRTPWRGILLYGPPGTGKSYLAKACATEANGTFYSVSSSDLVSKYLGESERLVRTLFEMARNSKPAIIFIDEIDSLCSSRSEGDNDATRRIKTEFLVQMQGVGHKEEGILVLGATNIPWELDSAVRRRFERRIYIPLPDENARAVMFKLHIGDTPNNLTDDDFKALARQTEGFSGSDIAVMVKSALMEPVRRCHKSSHFKKVTVSNKVCYTPCPPSDDSAIEMNILDIPPNSLYPPEVTADDFYAILDTAKPTVSAEDLRKHEEFTRVFGQEGN